MHTPQWLHVSTLRGLPLTRLVLLLGVLTVILSGCQSSGSSTEALPPPNIVWITAEDIGPALGAYGDEYARTPHLDRLAAEGTLYRNAFATAPICAPARSALITGVRAVSLGTQHLRSDIPIPDGIDALPEYLRARGYYTTNNAKTDYNFSAEGRWNESSGDAHWRNRPDGAPFFSVFNFGITHEGRVNRPRDGDLASLDPRHDPAQASLPPYFPDTPAMRRIWARQYDLITVLDQRVGALLQQLEDDGLMDNTIVFFFSDHGFGLPRYKRWLYNSGLRVPFIVRIPERYQHLADTPPGQATDRLVSFVDVAPTTLHLAGAAIPDHMHGVPFLGDDPAAPREYVYGTRSRADDVYDVSRTVTDGRFIYTRNFMPHRPYIQDAIIFGSLKESFQELRRVRAADGLPPEARDMFAPKPVEALYDLANDPYETENLIDSAAHQATRDALRSELRDWMLEVRDAGLLHEAEMMIRAEASTPYEMAQDDQQYDLGRILDAAFQVGDPSVPPTALTQRLQDPDSGVRFWAAVALLARGSDAASATDALSDALRDASPSVRLVAAEALCALDRCAEARPVLARALDDERPWVVLQAAIHLRQIGEQAQPLVPAIQEALARHRGDIWGRYKSWSYPMFIGFALDQVLINCGMQELSDLYAEGGP